MSVLNSSTTQNVAVATGGTVGGLAAVLTLLRQVAPDVVTWAPTVDAQIVAVASTVVVPLVSRAVAFFRDPSKRKRSRGYYSAPLVVALLALGATLQGCTTTTYPDGTVVQQLDRDTVWAAYQLYLVERERVAADEAMDRAERDARLRELDARLAEIAEQLRAGR